MRANVLENNTKRSCEALRSALEALPATLRSVPEALRSALDVLRSAPGHAATSGNFLRESLTGERLRLAQAATTPASSLKPSCSRSYPGILRKPTPSYHIVRSGRVEQLALPCTRIPLAPVPLGALRGTCEKSQRKLRMPVESF